MAYGLVESVDIYPTLTELAGLDTPGHAQGQSFKTLLDDPSSAGKTAVFPRWKNADSIRTDRYYYTEWRNQKGKVIANMLYDHENDPGETVNLAGQKKYSIIVSELSSRLKDHLQQLPSLQVEVIE